MTDVYEVLERARAKFAAASREEYPRACGQCLAPLRLHQETFRDPGRWTDPVGRTLCLPPHKGRHRAEPASGGVVEPSSPPTAEETDRG